MRQNKISESGIIDDNGKLRLPMDRINAFLAQHRGVRVIARFEVAEHGSSELQLAYYFNYIVPTIQTALYDTGERMSERQVDVWLRERCSMCTSSDADLIEARKMTRSAFSEFLEWLKQFAAENLNVYIEDPRTL